MVFPIAWTALYILMAVSFWRLWEKEPRSAARSKAIVWFLVQLAFNAAWSPVFFDWHDTKMALVIIVALLIAIGATILSASGVDRVAAWLLACRMGSLRDHDQCGRRRYKLNVWQILA